MHIQEFTQTYIIGHSSVLPKIITITTHIFSITKTFQASLVNMKSIFPTSKGKKIHSELGFPTTKILEVSSSRTVLQENLHLTTL